VLSAPSGRVSPLTIPLVLLCHRKRRLACFLSNRSETAKALAVRATVKYPNEPNLQVAAA
jgi:hypothetical protein